MRNSKIKIFFTVFCLMCVSMVNAAKIEPEQSVTAVKKNSKNESDARHVLAITPQPTIAELDEDGFAIRSASGDNELRLGLLLQTDQDIFMDTKGVTINNGTASTPITNRNTVDRIWIRRARPIFSGHLFKYNNFVFVPDFSQGQTRLFDAFVDVHYIKWLGVSAGKQLSLLAGIEQLKDASTFYSTESGYSSTMAPNREIGIMLHGQWAPPGVADKTPYVEQHGFNEWFSYQIGVFSGTADDTNPGLNPSSSTGFSTETATLENKGIEARVFSNPFLGQSHNVWLQGLGVGLATGFDSPNNEADLPAILSVGQNPIFTYEPKVAANGERYRFHPQGYWFVGSFGMVGDWAFTAQHILNQTTTSAPPNQISSMLQHNHAGQIQVIYNLTGEKNKYMEKLTPDRAFNPTESGAWGAFQLVGRWSGLFMDPNVFNSQSVVSGNSIYTYADPRLSVSKANTLSIGLNWMLNKYVRVMTEYDQTRFKGGCSTGAMSAAMNPGCLTSGNAAFAVTSQVMNRQDEKVIMQRIQVQY
jgi:phosphate-selective porin OprO/OprP